jgi:hypothetical protein
MRVPVRHSVAMIFLTPVQADEALMDFALRQLDVVR